MDEFLRKSAKTLELDKILSMLADRAVSPGAKRAAEAAEPVKSLREAERLQQETAAAFTLSVRKGSPSFYGTADIRDAAERAVRGASLSMKELLTVAGLLYSARMTYEYRFRDMTAEPSCLDEFFSLIRYDFDFEQRIKDSILSENDIADSASPALSSIRRRINAAHARVRDILSDLISSPRHGKLLQEAIITQRGGRYVVPVKAENKNDLPGMTHDVSSSGATVFIEPMAVVRANNEIAELAAEEKKEIERILAELSAEVAMRSDMLNLSLSMLVKLDLIFARAKLAYEMDAFPPVLNTDGVFALKKARHPLLDGKKVVPIDITLGEGFTTLIITGPNTGGKTVSLKTAGLLTLMAACGLHIPAAHGSAVPLCSGVYADIGDEQSIEQSLSTFSSHMTNIVKILGSADSNSLVLFDELGAGTDPTEGAALAVAIIERVASSGARIIATTHYAELKVYALNTPGVENASCEFDVETLRPTFRLLTGVPGRSNAFAISSRLGLDGAVIETARSLVGREAGRFEDVIDRLESSRQKMEQEKAEAEKLRAEIEVLNKKARERESLYAAEKKKLLDEAKRDAEKIIEKTKLETDAMLEEIRELRRRAEREEVRPELNAAGSESRRKLRELAEGLSAGEAKEEVGSPVDRPLVPGDAVWLAKIGARGSVLSVNGDDVAVQAGILKVTAKASDLRFAPEEPEKKRRRDYSPAPSAEAVKEAAAANRLDIRGMAVDEGLLELDRFIETALRQHIPSASVIHGKGTGKLRDAVRKQLKTVRVVKSFRPGVYGEGEDGVTIVEF